MASGRGRRSCQGQVQRSTVLAPPKKYRCGVATPTPRATRARSRSGTTRAERFLEDLPGGFPLKEPQTCLDFLKSLVAVGRRPEMSHLHWRRDRRVSEVDRAVYEDDVLGMTLRALAMVEQVNCAKLVWCEMLCCRPPFLREAYRVSSANPDYSASDFKRGCGRRRGTAAIQSSLTSYVREQLRTATTISAGARTARKERQLRCTSGGTASRAAAAVVVSWEKAAPPRARRRRNDASWRRGGGVGRPPPRERGQAGGKT